jgi:two-component system phosphate regulon sensor histidine kinase PhoR
LVVVLGWINAWAALAALAIMSMAGVLARNGVGAEFEAFEDLVDTLRGADASVHLGLPEGLPGDAGRLVNALRAAAEAKHREHESVKARAERVHTLLQASPGGVMLLDEHGRIELVNQAALRMMPPRTDPLGRRPLEAFSVIEVHEAADVAMGGAVYEDRLAVSGDIDILVLGIPLDHGAMVVVRDISRFQRAERARTDFVANVSHELRTPIAAIMGFAETLQDEGEALPPHMQMMVAAIHRNGARLSRLFDDLLNLYKIEARRRELPRERVELSGLLAGAVTVAADEAATNGQAFELDCPEGLVAWANPEALGAIVANLASNACKYTPRGGRVTVRALQVGDEVHIEVEDTGVGIPRTHQVRIFERFYRVDAGRSREVGGTGLGLAIVKHLAKATGCTVEVRSEEGQGSVFTVRVATPPDGEVLPTTWTDTPR